MAKEALADNTTTLMHMSVEQVLGVDWFKAICHTQWSLGLSLHETPGGQTPGGAAVATVLQDGGEDQAATVITTTSIWRKLGCFGEEFVLPYLTDMVTRLRMAGCVVRVVICLRAWLRLWWGEDEGRRVRREKTK